MRSKSVIPNIVVLENNSLKNTPHMKNAESTAKKKSTKNNHCIDKFMQCFYYPQDAQKYVENNFKVLRFSTQPEIDL